MLHALYLFKEIWYMDVYIRGSSRSISMCLVVCSPRGRKTDGSSSPLPFIVTLGAVESHCFHRRHEVWGKLIGHISYRSRRAMTNKFLSSPAFLLFIILYSSTICFSIEKKTFVAKWYILMIQIWQRERVSWKWRKTKAGNNEMKTNKFSRVWKHEKQNSFVLQCPGVLFCSFQSKWRR